LSLESRRELVQPDHEFSIRQQCELLGVDRSGLYREPLPESAENQKLMRLLDKEYTRHPVYGVRRMTLFLRDLGYVVNAKRVRRLLRLMGLEALFPKPRLSIPDPIAGKYPYLLRGLNVERPDQVWCADITYIGLEEGWAYLVAIMDWFSPLRPGLGSFQHAGKRFLRERAGAGLARRERAGDPQHRPGQPVHQRRMDWNFGASGRAHQPGWTRPRLRQHLH
jgi:hypothetical protein